MVGRPEVKRSNDENCQQSTGMSALAEILTVIEDCGLSERIESGYTRTILQVASASPGNISSIN